jgi:hypothetical protein
MNPSRKNGSDVILKWFNHRRDLNIALILNHYYMTRLHCVFSAFFFFNVAAYCTKRQHMRVKYNSRHILAILND